MTTTAPQPVSASARPAVARVRETRNAADPWLVAHCAEHGRVVVSQERAKGANTAPQNLKIPNVAETYGVDCLNFNGLARAEAGPSSASLVSAEAPQRVPHADSGGVLTSANSHVLGQVSLTRGFHGRAA